VWPYGLAVPRPAPLAASRSLGASCWSRDRSEDRPSTGPRCRSEKDVLVSGSSSVLLDRRRRAVSSGGAEAARGWPAMPDGPDGPAGAGVRAGWVTPGGVALLADWGAPRDGGGVEGTGGRVMLLTGWVAAYAGWTTVLSADRS